MTINVVDAAFAKAIADVDAAAASLRETRNRVDKRVSAFLGVDWRGDAAESFVEPWGDWVEGARAAERGLTAMAGLLEATRHDFRVQDIESQHSLDQVSQRIVERLG